MSITRNCLLSLSGQNAPVSIPFSVTADEENDFAFQVTAAATNEQHIFGCTSAKLQQIIIESDQAMTLKTNSSGSPQDTIVLVAGIPFVWTAGCGMAYPFAGAVTTGYFTNGSSTLNANVKINMMSNS